MPRALTKLTGDELLAAADKADALYEKYEGRFAKRDEREGNIKGIVDEDDTFHFTGTAPKEVIEASLAYAVVNVSGLLDLLTTNESRLTKPRLVRSALITAMQYTNTLSIQFDGCTRASLTPRHRYGRRVVEAARPILSFYTKIVVEPAYDIDTRAEDKNLLDALRETIAFVSALHGVLRATSGKGAKLASAEYLASAKERVLDA